MAGASTPYDLVRMVLERLKSALCPGAVRRDVRPRPGPRSMVSVITEVAVMLTVHIRDIGAGSGGGGREGWIVEAVVRAGIRAFHSDGRWCR